MSSDWIKRHDHHAELDSTSSHLARLWRSGELSPSDTPIVISTDHQTAGRGRGEHSWFSDNQSLTFTLGIRPEEFGLALADVIPIGLLAACCMIESIEALWPSIAGQIGIRWPNDIECDLGKIGGVLPECIIQDSTGMLLLIGIGVNIGTDLSHSPAEARLIGCSLKSLIPSGGQICHSPTTLLGTFLQAFPRHFSQLLSPKVTWIAHAQRLDRLSGHRIEARQGHQIIHGTALGWNDEGYLVVRTDQGDLATISSGQIMRNLPSSF
jgi:BirA family biotin operon repressor/biotin-[acetyl-CoA-carboxylase] ligase